MGKALAKSPDDRYDRCIDFARALGRQIGVEEQALGADSTMLAPAASGPRHARAAEATKRRRTVVSIAAALGLIVVAAVAFVLFDRMRDHSTPAPSDGVTLPVVVVGANCATSGAAGITEGGAPAYCAHLSSASATIWSTYPGEISSPTVTAGPNDGGTGACLHGADGKDESRLPRRHPAGQHRGDTDVIEER